MMKRAFWIGFVLAMAVSARTLVADQSANDLFQKALSKELVEGQLTEAIALYERVVSEFASDRAMAAKALLQMGRCYERLGKTDAQKAYERVLREYADQRAVADEARARLAELDESRAAAAATPSARLLWSGAGVDTQGAPSPDGRYLSYVDHSGNPNGNLAIRDLVTGQTRLLTQGDSSTPGAEFAASSVFAPGGRQIAFAWLNKDGFFELRVTRTDRPASRTLYRNAELGHLEPAAWLPDGKSIITVLEGHDGHVRIALVSAATGMLRVLKTLPWKWPSGLSVSPDGRFLAYAVAVEPTLKHDVFVVALDGSRESALVEHGSDDTSPMWTPDGSGVVFVSDRSGTLDAWLVPVSDGRAAGPATALRRNLGRGRPMGITLGGALVYAGVAHSQDVYIGAFDPASGRASAGSSAISERFMGSNYSPDWSPDGSRVAYVSQRGLGGPGSRAIVVRSLADGSEREIVPRLRYFHRPRWTPDGRALVASGAALRGPHGLFTIDVETGAITTLVANEPGASANHQVWSSDGRTLFYSADEGIVAQEMTTGVERRVYEGEANEKAVSPDGKWLAFQTIDAKDGSASSIRLVPTTGGPARVVLGLRAPERVFYFGGLNWTSDGERLLFVKQSGERRELWRVHVTTGLAESTGLVPPGLIYVRLHPDGRRLVFAAGRRQEEVWLIEHFLPSAQRRTVTAAVSSVKR